MDVVELFSLCGEPEIVVQMVGEMSDGANIFLKLRFDEVPK